MIWLLVLFVWTALSMLVGCVVGLCIRQADEIEQPTDAEALADFELRRIDGWL